MSFAVATLVAVLLVVSSPPASAAVPGAAPANPTEPCTWNWNRWSAPDTFAFPYTDDSFDPTQRVFSQVGGWYEASGPPQFNYSGLPEGVGPAEATTGAKDAEWTYGVGYYVLNPGSRQTITISDSGRQESHAFAFFNSAGQRFARYPSSGYVASEEEAKSDPSSAGGVPKGKAWSASVTITVPSDGIFYIHYLNFDERIRAKFASFSGACGPVAVNDESSDNIPVTAVTVDVTENDSKVDPTTVAIVGANPATRELVVEGEGRWRVSSGGITFVPEPTFTLDPQPIRYTASNGQGQTTRPASVVIDYQPIFSTADKSPGNPSGETVSIRVTDNDSHVVRSSVSVVGANASGGLVDAGRGTWSTDRSTGTISYVSLPDFDGDPRPISYTVKDVGGALLPAVAVELSFAPDAESDESLENLPGDIARIDVLENDPSSDINPKSVAIVGAGPDGVLVVPDEGEWSVDPETNEVLFSPEPTFASDPEVRSYTVADITGNRSEPAELFVDYVPATRKDESLGHPAGSIITLSVLENDPSKDLDPTTVLIDHPNYDLTTRTLEVAGEGTWTVNAETGDITVTPLLGFRGEPTPIAYTVEDDDGSVARPAEVIIGHLPLPAAAADESLDNVMGEPVTIDVLKNDPTELDPTTVKIVGADDDGELDVPREGSWLADPVTGAIVFDPQARFDENPTPITYVAKDELGVSTAPETVTVTYFGVIPESLAFVEPADIDWMTVGLQGALASVLLLISGGLALFGRLRPSRQRVLRS